MDFAAVSFLRVHSCQNQLLHLVFAGAKVSNAEIIFMVRFCVIEPESSLSFLETKL